MSDLLDKFEAFEKAEKKPDEKPVVSLKKPTEKPTTFLKKGVEKKTLHPPKPAKMISDDFFVELANSTEFKRFIYKVLYGTVHRTEKQHGNLDEKVKVGLQVFQEFGRGTTKDFREVVNELKEKLAKQKEKIKDE